MGHVGRVVIFFQPESRQAEKSNLLSSEIQRHL